MHSGLPESLGWSSTSAQIRHFGRTESTHEMYLRGTPNSDGTVGDAVDSGSAGTLSSFTAGCFAVHTSVLSE